MYNSIGNMSEEEIGIMIFAVFMIVMAVSTLISLVLWGISNTVHVENSPLMQKALGQLNNRWSNPIVVMVVYGAITIGFSIMESVFDGISDVFGSGEDLSLILIALVFSLINIVVSLIGSLIKASLTWGSAFFFLNFVRNRDNGLSDLFMPFRNKVDFFRAFGCSFMIGLFTILWALLLIVPGIIAAYSYSMTFFILSHNPNTKVMDAIALSKSLMDGHKAQLFWLQYRFFGWHLLSVLTLGIGYIWLAPYIATTTANFFESIIPHQENDSAVQTASV